MISCFGIPFTIAAALTVVWEDASIDIDPHARYFVSDNWLSRLMVLFASLSADAV